MPWSSVLLGAGVMDMLLMLPLTCSTMPVSGASYPFASSTAMSLRILISVSLSWDIFAEASSLALRGERETGTARVVTVGFVGVFDAVVGAVCEDN
jgi:hypothetical protein